MRNYKAKQDDANKRMQSKDTLNSFVFTPVTKEELEKRRVPVYPYIL